MGAYTASSRMINFSRFSWWLSYTVLLIHAPVGQGRIDDFILGEGPATRHHNDLELMEAAFFAESGKAPGLRGERIQEPEGDSREWG